MDDLDKNLCCQSGEGIFKAEYTVSVLGTVILAYWAVSHAACKESAKHKEYQYLRQTSYFVYPGLKSDNIHACKGTLALHCVKCHVTIFIVAPCIL